MMQENQENVLNEERHQDHVGEMQKAYQQCTAEVKMARE